ncbi:DUF2599 domain-containing protein [Gordonia sp. DT218]|uniref:DUF2599 domain-containing protein n=1 Tax=unclassified Gordonia (in: high G+C Gram-positive bacteria) TaxID=2657482 RepID=UPI003CF13CD0
MGVDRVSAARCVGSIVGIVCAVLVVAFAMSGCGSSGEVSGNSVSAPETTTTTTSVPGAVESPAPVFDPPYVDHVEWVQTAVGPSLQVHPTTSGRRTDDPRGADVAWHEVLAQAPDADTPGMRAQFDCHWQFARLVEPNKPSWNLEPSRPVVTDQVMIETRCNPGGPEE